MQKTNKMLKIKAEVPQNGKINKVMGKDVKRQQNGKLSGLNRLPKISESKLQSQCVVWFRSQYRDALIFAVPNGGKRNIVTATIQKREGVVSGVSDLIVLKAMNGFNGLCVEMKISGTKQTESQIWFQKYCESNNYKYVVCKSLDEFMTAVNQYLTSELPTHFK